VRLPFAALRQPPGGSFAPSYFRTNVLLSGHGRLSDTPQDDVHIAIQRSHGLLEDTAQLFDALDARQNFEPIMQSVRDLNKLDDN
jgi:hydroxyacylglutathione hydrolase